MDEKVLAVAAGHPITEKELNELIANYPPEQQIYLSDPNAKAEVLEQLIGFHLFSKMAEEENIRESKEFKETLAKMENELASHMAATSVVGKATVEEAEARAYYDANPYQFLIQEKEGGKEGDAVPYEEVKEQLLAVLLQQKKQEAYMRKIKELEETYGVERR